MNLKKLIKIITIILLIILALESIYFKFGHCDKFNEEFNGKDLSAKEVIKLYDSACWSNKSLYPENIINNEKINYEIKR